MDLNPVRARCFLEVVERGTVVAAATSLGYSAPAVSQQISKLERSLGVALFDRVSGRLRTTAAGTALVPHAYAVLDALESGRNAALSAAGSARRRAAVSAFPSAMINLVAPVAGSAAPVGRLVEAEDDDSVRSLLLGHTDVAIIQEHNHDKHPRDRRLVHHRLLRDPLDLVVPAGRALPRTLSAAGGSPWVVAGAGSPCRRATEQAWARARIAPDIAAEAFELSTMLTLVGHGLGVALMPRLGLPTDLPGARIAPGASPVVRTVFAVTRRTHSGGDVARVVAALQAQGRRVAEREIGRWADADATGPDEPG